MAGCINKTALLGYLGQDPEVRSMPDGRKVCSLSMATTESWKDKEGKKHERTEWHRIVIFNEGLVGVAERFLSKGSRVYIEGSNRTREWSDQAGVSRKVTEVVVGQRNGALVLLDARKSGDDRSSDLTHTEEDFDDIPY